MEQTFEILINELVADEEFRDSFLRNPRRALHLAGDWGLPLCEERDSRVDDERALAVG